MTSIETLRVEPVVTTARIGAAWAGVTTAGRRGTVVACVASVAVVAASSAPVSVRGAAALTGVLLALAALVDVRERRLPNRLLVAALLVTLVGALAALDAQVVARTVIGLLAAGVPMLAVRLTRGVGMGDVKMAAVVGASGGSFLLIAAPVAIAAAASIAAVFGTATRHRSVPLGPALWLGWALAIGGAAAGWLQ